MTIWSPGWQSRVEKTPLPFFQWKLLSFHLISISLFSATNCQLEFTFNIQIHCCVWYQNRSLQTLKKCCHIWKFEFWSTKQFFCQKCCNFLRTLFRQHWRSGARSCVTCRKKRKPARLAGTAALTFLWPTRWERENESVSRRGMRTRRGLAGWEGPFPCPKGWTADRTWAQAHNPEKQRNKL